MTEDIIETVVDIITAKYILRKKGFYMLARQEHNLKFLVQSMNEFLFK